MDKPERQLVVDTRTPGEHLALLLTLVINPLVLPPLIVFLVLNGRAAASSDVISAVLATTVFFAAIPFVAMAAIAWSRKNVTIELRDRRYRTIPFAISIVSNLLALWFFSKWDSEHKDLMTTLMIVYLLNNIILMVINFRFKISLHMASIAGTASILLFMVAGLRPIHLVENRWVLAGGIVFLILIPTLWWSRQRLGAHTRSELTAGALFGLIVPFVELYILSPLVG